MGRDFRRARSLPGVNALLNYGYTVLRAAAVRSVCAAGLHPMLALHHRTRGNGMRLADDLMEPFRPAVDLATVGLMHGRDATLDEGAKRTLASVLTMDYEIEGGAMSPLSICMVRLAQSIGGVFEGKRGLPEFPRSPIPVADGEEEAF
jgi:CRISPR-associated protein Cas1